MIIATNSRMFVTNASTRSNAMVVTKEGRVGIGANTPLAKINPVLYTFKTDEFPKQFDKKKHFGVIAHCSKK